MISISNTKIGVHKNQPRLWLEGSRLFRAGIQIGARYGVTADKEKGRIELSQVTGEFDGQIFTVSKRSRNGIEHPVMDIRSNTLKEIFENSERVRVAIRDGRIVITANHLDTKVQERVARVRQRLQANEPLKVCSLFHGGGVIDKAMHEGMHRAGVQSYAQVAVEMEATYLDSSIRNNPELWRADSLQIVSDIREVNLSNNAPKCDLLIGGIPCTGASKSGRSKNKLSCAEEHGSAGSLFVDYLDAVKAVNPAVCVIENVAEYQSSASMMVIRSVLTSLGYKLTEAILDGSEFGSLERRKRLAVVAYTPGIADSFNFGNLVSVKERESNLGEILEDIPLDSPRWKSFDYLAEKEIRDIAAGKGFRRQLLTAESDGCGVNGRGYAKCRSTESFLVHPTDSSLSRIFTPVEHGRVKGIPEEVIHGESDTSAHEILGQSVIYPLFVAVGNELGRAMRESVQDDLAEKKVLLSEHDGQRDTEESLEGVLFTPPKHFLLNGAGPQVQLI